MLNTTAFSEREKYMDEYNQNPATRDLEPSVPENKPQPSPRRPQKRGGFLPGILGVVVGALLVWFIMQGGSSTKETPLVDVSKQQAGIQTERLSFDMNNDITDIVGKVADSVVGITNLQTVHDPWSPVETTRETGSGSGVIYKKQGDKAYIVTNHHVVEGAQELEITFDDGSKTAGKTVGSDMWTDLAVIEIDAKPVKTVIGFGDSDALKRGETVIAIGNPLGLGFSGSVTVGVVSGKDRSIPIDFDENGTVDWFADVLQTDAAINPGNSGGALINLAGQLIGINSMKISEATVEGIGLAIPINLATPIIDQLEKNGKVNRPTMGVTLLDLRSIPAQQQRDMLKLPATITDGVVVNEVMSKSAAEIAGVMQYDVIVEMDGVKIEDMVSLRKHLYNAKNVGDMMQMKVYREGKLLEIEMVLKDGNSF
ncbi:MAG TPA: trypsin-like peptidase domain-containing protein [Sporosarcina psychrophila]|uniref:Trypsin-like peptidase domain-containing protein n=1 Tax=Sporosarcina psychrophila TaxID=1476 RepID=A0A921KCH7_SPOPS|nr:trypsin-like peptidase domain-containing protein [Sporosarcina psychrophila]